MIFESYGVSAYCEYAAVVTNCVIGRVFEKDVAE